MAITSCSIPTSTSSPPPASSIAENRFHLLPVESIEPLAELFRQRFLATLLEEKLISERKLRELLGWKHSGFNLDAGDKPIPAHNLDALRSMAEYLLRAPFSLEKITWNPATSPRHLPFQPELAHQAQLRGLHRRRLPRRRNDSQCRPNTSRPSLLRPLLQQAPRHGKIP